VQNGGEGEGWELVSYFTCTYKKGGSFIRPTFTERGSLTEERKEELPIAHPEDRGRKRVRLWSKFW